ncbi:MAG TPA: PKD domain-containing protein, partial [Cyclobacteriaceae bacterium]|nr:PKD domain-containing protein [Cyclobacteriaceae bacterium]
TTGACPPFTAHFEDTSVPDIEKWEWTFGDGKSSVLQDPANIYTKPGDFNVTLKVTDKNGCTDTKLVNQFVKVGGPRGSFTTTGANSCTNQTVDFNASTVNAATLRWDFGDGVVIDSKSPKQSHAYTQTGSFTPSLLLIDANNCQTLADGPSTMIIKDTTVVSFTIAPKCVRPGEPVRFSGANETDDVITWSWLVGGTYVGSGTKFDATIDKPGLHVITGLAANQFNCISHVYDSVRIQGPLTTIPNVITPNGDRYNEVFTMIGLENSTWDIDIVNRWGNTVFRKKDYKGDWDGGDQPPGVYYFVLRNSLCDDPPYKGYISVHR